jgi:hypothetical protein
VRVGEAPAVDDERLSTRLEPDRRGLSGGDMSAA